MKILLHTLKSWLPLAAAIVLICGVIEVAVQQNFRTNANDPQIQLAEDTASALENGQTIDALIPAGRVDIAASLAPYLVLYGPDSQPTAGNGYLHDSLPAIPNGVFEHAARQGRDMVSWQPEPGVRSAVVVVPVNSGKDGYVMAGRSLREVEVREDALTTIWAAGCAAALAVSLVLVFLLEVLPIKPR